MADQFSPEAWANRPHILELLASILAHPAGDHAAAVAALPEGVLLNAHVASIVRVLDGLRSNVAFANSFTSVAGVALHTILFHLLGGASQQLPAPPTAPVTRDDIARCASGWAVAKPAAKKFFSDMAAARFKEKQGDGAELHRLRTAVFAVDSHKNLRPAAGAGGAAAAKKAAAAATGAGGDDSTPPTAAAIQAAHTARLLAFAMGTHERLGEGYSSYDGPCAVRRLANDHDVLGLIGDYVRGKPKRTLAPPPREVVLLRFRLANVDRERVDWRQAADDLQVRLATATAEAQRWARQAASARNEAVELRSSCERRVAAEAQRVEEVQEGAAAWKELHQRTWTQQRKVERQEAAAAAREKERWLTERWMDERAAREAHGLRHVSELESMSGDRRDEIKRLAAERDAAEAAATEFERQYHEQQAAAERLRSARNGSALERQAALEQELREAKRRRTQNQRRLSDANLSDTRWRNAQAQLDSLREQLAEYMMEDEGQRSRATRADAFERQVAQLQSQLESETAKLRSQIAELQSQHKEETAELQSQLKEQTEQCAKYRAVAEPSKAKFFADRRYTADVDLTSLEVIADLGVSANVVPRLFFIFARFYGIKIPTRKVRVLVGRDAAGKRVYEEKDVPYIPGLTHMKELPAIGRELHKLQVGEWLLQDPDGNYCYIADGANSQQREILAQILSRRNKETGRLESMSLSIDEITDKTSEGQLRKFTSALEAIAEGWEEAASLGLLDMPEQADDAGADAGTTATPDADAGADAEPPASAAAFFEQRRKLLRAALRGKIAGLRAASSMNDRAPNARKAGRLGRGGNGSGGEGDVTDDPTCAHHAVANIGEEGRKAIDKRLKAKMNITEEQSEADSAKVKALRTNVGWFSSPSCSLIYQVIALRPRVPCVLAIVCGRVPGCSWLR